MRESGFDNGTLLLLNKFVEGLPDWDGRQRVVALAAVRFTHDVRRQVARQNQIILAQGAGPLDRVLQLAHISWITVMTQNIDGLRVDLFGFPPSCTCLFLQEMLHEQRYVLPALAQRRNLTQNDRQPR